MLGVFFRGPKEARRTKGGLTWFPEAARFRRPSLKVLRTTKATALDPGSSGEAEADWEL